MRLPPFIPGRPARYARGRWACAARRSWWGTCSPGEGLILGLRLTHEDGKPWDVGEVNRLRLACRDQRLLTSYSAEFLPVIPPLTITSAECDEPVKRLNAALRACIAEHPYGG